MKGLESRFTLQQGKFVLTEGIQKSRDAIWFYCIFDKYRVYTSDFGARLHILLEKPISYLNANRTILLGRLSTGIAQYVPSVVVRSLDFGFTSQNKKSVSLRVDYDSVTEDKVKINDVTFV